MNLLPAIFLMLLFTLLAAFFQLSEAAILTANFSRVRQLEEDGDPRAVLLAALRTAKKSAFHVTVRTVTAVCCFAVSAICLQYLCPAVKAALIRHEWLTPPAASWVTLLGTMALIISLYLINGHIIPRKVGIHRCESIAYAVAGVMSLCVTAGAPYTGCITAAANLCVKVFGVPAHIDEKLVTEDEILMMVDASGEKGVIEESEADMIANIFEFGDTTASEAMTHRTDVEALEYTADVHTAVSFALENGFSRIPVYKDDLDNIQGVLYVKDLLRFVGRPEECDTPIYKLMRPACYIPETKKLSELFGEMTETKVQMAVVVDEYGGTSGIITMEDLIESILGNIQDEFDNEDEEISRLSEDTFTIDGTTSVYEVSDLLDIELPEGDYDTLAGYIVSTLGRIPTENEHPTVSFDHYDFTVEQVTDRRISRVHVVKRNASQEAAPSDDDRHETPADSSVLHRKNNNE